MTNNEQRLAEIRARNAARTQGEWKDTVTEDGELIVHAKTRQPHVLGNNLSTLYPLCYLGDMETTEAEDHDNAAFIAHAAEDIAYLLAELDQKNALIERTGRTLVMALDALENLQLDVNALLNVVNAAKGVKVGE